MPSQITLQKSCTAKAASAQRRARSARARLARRQLSDFPDRTGYECFVNHVHIDDYVSDASPPALAALGVAFAERLCDALTAHGGKFAVIVSSDDTSCSVRFHRLRDGEQRVADNLESYRDEGVLVIS
jgi:hypothetical protein